MRADHLHSAAAASVGKRRLARYVILDELGRGGMGAVYLAYDPDLARKLAIKVVALNESAANFRIANDSENDRLHEHLLTEARALARLAHPNIVPIFDVGVADGRVFLAMEFVEGCSLRRWLDDKRRTWTEVSKVMVAVGQGLDTIHRAGLCHRDIKPDNILIRHDGVPMLIDFGLAQTQVSGEIAGTPGYMAPEQCEGSEVGATADVFAFCTVWLEGILRRRLFEAPSLDEYRQCLAAGPTFTKTDGPRWLIRMLLAGLAGDPQRRPASIGEVLATFESEWSRRQSRRVHALGYVFSFAAIIGAIALPGSQREPPVPPVVVQVQRALELLDEPQVWRAAEAGIYQTGLQDASDLWNHLRSALDERRAIARQTFVDAQLRAHSLQESNWSCLLGHVTQLNTLLEIVALGQRQVARQAMGALAGMGDVSACLSTRALSSTAAPKDLPRDDATKRRLALARLELGRMDLMIAAGAYGDAQALGHALDSEGEKLGYAPLRAEIYDALARLEIYRSNGQMARFYLERSLIYAVEGGHDSILAAARTHLPYIESFFLGNLEGRDDRLAESWSAVRRANFPPSASAEWYRVRALFALFSNAPENCHSFVQNGIDWEWRTGKPDHIGRAVRFSDLGFCSMMIGQPDRAAEEFRRALKYGEQVLGPNHPGLFAPVHNLAVVSNARFNFVQARHDLYRGGRLLESQQDAIDQMFWHCGEALSNALAFGELESKRSTHLPCDEFLRDNASSTHARAENIVALLALRDAMRGDKVSAKDALDAAMKRDERGIVVFDTTTDGTLPVLTWFDVALMLGDVRRSEQLLTRLERFVTKEEMYRYRARLAFLRGDWHSAFEHAERAIDAVTHHPTTLYGSAALVLPYLISARAARHLGDGDFAYRQFRLALAAGEQEFPADAPLLGEIYLELAFDARSTDAEILHFLNQAFRASQHGPVSGDIESTTLDQGIALVMQRKVEPSAQVRDWLNALALGLGMADRF
jgi:serine/threonine-protein kinase